MKIAKIDHEWKMAKYAIKEEIFSVIEFIQLTIEELEKLKLDIKNKINGKEN